MVRQRDFAKQMRVALEFMLSRTEQALELIAQAKFDQAIHMLHMRNVAFHNFRIAEELATHHDPALYSELRALWGKICHIDKKLDTDLESYKQELAHDLTKIKKELRAINRFRSQQAAESEISLSV